MQREKVMLFVWKGSTNPNPFDFLTYVFEPLHIFICNLKYIHVYYKKH